MKKLYKYYSSNLNIESYLAEPTIRICQLNVLNDPFEGFITQDVLDKLVNRAHPTLPRNKGASYSEIYHARKHIRNQIDSIGISSFSETSRNLLMWSHYASEHKGICIGYKMPLIKAHSSREIPLPKLRKVNYDSLLFDHEYIELLKNKSIDTDTVMVEIGERILTTKSDSWSYEKEHRYITPIERCNIIKYQKSKSSIPKYIEAAINKAVSENSHRIIEEDSHITLISKRTTRQLIESLTNPESVEMQMKQSKDVMFLKKVSKTSIDSIYFGAKIRAVAAEEIAEKIKENETYKDIKLYHYKKSTNRYEIEPIPL
ncbi:DUF2971 domain-containing protein [Aeromonas caviae]|uniref:DUF2971 domain-containing protein n=1 Tax=Aeromonas caviae TaxID=648 RepID=UPI00191E9DA4|nr:DUF2971 domain-containing protein [Aeromonas caviae]MBL0508167.1 DUF2971 domain-containing protein [Aeromonas caviae]